MRSPNNGSPGGGRGAAPISDDTAEILRRFDLPAYLEENWPDCKMTGRGDSRRCVAAWRGGDGSNVALTLKNGKWLWDDHARGEGGDAITFLQAYEDLSPKDAWNRAREITGVRSSYDHATPGPTAPPKAPKPKGDAKPPKPESQAPKPVPFNPAELPLQTFEDKMRGWKLAGRHVLYDLEGRPMAVQTRHEKSGRPKMFLYWTLGADGGWESSLRGLPLGGLWFRLPEALDRPEAPVLIVEGPKTAEAAAPLFSGYAVVSPPGGKGSLKNADWSPFKGRRVTLWPDADADHGSQVAFSGAADLLQAAGAAEVRLVELPPGLPDGWDMADPAPEGVNVLELLQAAEVVGKPAEDEPEEDAPRWPMMSLSDLEDLPPIPWLIEDTFREKGLFLLYGESGVGKSWTALDMALSIATGSQWGPRETRRGRVLYLTLEDGWHGTKPRAVAWSRSRGIGIPAENLKLMQDVVPLDRAADVDAFILEVKKSGFQPDLIIFDTLALSTAGIDENAAKDTGAVIGNLKRIQRELNAGVMLVHHATKANAETYRGSTSWMAAVDTMVAVVSQGETFAVKCMKQRSAPRFPEMSWKLEPVPGVMYENRPMVTTRYLEDGSSESQAPKKRRLTEKQELVRRALEVRTIDKGGSGPAELARDTGFSKSTCQGALDALQLQGYAFYDAERKLYHTPRNHGPSVRKSTSYATPSEALKNEQRTKRTNDAEENFVRPMPFNDEDSGESYEAYETYEGELRTGGEAYVRTGVLRNPVRFVRTRTPDLEADPVDDGEEV